MKSLKNSLQKYHKLLEDNEIQEGYKELINFITKLQRDFKVKYPEYEVAKGMYQGYLDLTFFTFTTEELKAKQLKIAIVFLHKEMRFEGWLSGRNRDVMSTYHKKISGHDIGEYLLANDEKGMVSIIEAILVSDPNFDNLNELAAEIENKTVGFVKDINRILKNTLRV